MSSKNGSREQKSASELIDEKISALGDWRGDMLARLRALIKQADPAVVEAWKWKGVPVWEHAGIICTGETYRTVVKMTFAKGASLEDRGTSSTPASKAAPGARSISRGRPDR